MLLPSPLTLPELASWLSAGYDGPEGHLITGINEIHMVSKGDITFVDHPKYYAKALESAATTIIINKKVEVPEGKALIFHDDPFTAFVSLIKRFRAFEPSSGMISPSARIGDGTIIQPGTFVGHHVTIGRNCLIHANVSIYDHSVIGDNVIIHSGSVIGADGLYFKRRPEGYDKLVSGGRAVIGNNVEIGACCTIDKGSTGDTTIGDGTKFDNHIQIGHDTVVGKNCLFAAQVGVAGVVTIEDDVILWGQVGVQKDLRIGKGAVVLGQSGIGKDLEAGKVYFGSPCKEATTHIRELASLKELPALIVSLRQRLSDD